MADETGRVRFRYLLLSFLISASLLVVLVMPAYVHYDLVRSTGAYAPLYLYEHSPYDSIVVEVHYSDDVRPSDAALEGLRSMLEKYSGKKVYLTSYDDIRPYSISPIESDEDIYSTGESMLARYRRQDPGWICGNLTMYVLYLNSTGPDPRLGSSNTVVGVSYRANSFMIFKNNIATDSIEESVLVHEAGHLLGLEHDENDQHCVMTSVLIQKHSWLTGGSSPPLDFCERHEKELSDRRHDPFYASKDIKRMIAKRINRAASIPSRLLETFWSARP